MIKLGMSITKYSAGGVLLNKANKVYLIHKLSRNEWSLPKGTVEKNEDTLSTAIREIKEETGFNNLTNLTIFPVYISHYYFKDEQLSQEINKYVSYFIFLTEEEIPIKTVEMETEGLEGAWFDLEEAINIVKFDDAKETLKEALNFINNKPIDLFLLGGNSIKNLDWIKSVDYFFDKNFNNKKIIYYSHWTQHEKYKIDIYQEAQNLAKIAKNSNDYYVFAKSVGIMITLIAILDYGLKPKRCVFVGFPISFLESIDFKSYIQNLNVNSILLQNSHDPYASYKEMEILLNDIGNKNLTLIESIGDTHDYNQLKNYLELLN